jgi:uncharacterized membrane-anchored protein
MKNRLIILCVVLQIAVLGWMAGNREWIVRTGDTVWLRTAPVDPSDPMRGDYVTLNYEIANPDKKLYSPALQGRIEALNNDWRRRQEVTVYAALEATGKGPARVVSVDLQPPTRRPFIKGVYGGSWSWRWRGNIRYGIDAFFLQQGTGGELEQPMRDGIPLEMEVALGRDGTAVIKGYRLAALGMQIKEKREKRPEKSEDYRQQPLIGLDVTFVNTTGADLAVVLPPDASTLVPRPAWGDELQVRRRADKPVRTVFEASDLRMVPAHQSITIAIDPRQWWSMKNAKGDWVPLGSEAERRYLSYRIEYQPPPPAALASLPESRLVSPERIMSARAFSE